jgi:transcriptional regulator of heat shock response
MEVTEDIDDGLWADLQSMMEQAGAGTVHVISGVRMPTTMAVSDYVAMVEMVSGEERSNTRHERAVEKVLDESDRDAILSALSQLESLIENHDFEAASDEQIRDFVQELEHTLEELW